MNFFRHKVSKKKKRYISEGYDLDLSFITDRIIAMGFPSTSMEKIYRNDASIVKKFLNSKFSSHYRVYNLCCERRYSSTMFSNQLVELDVEDHNAAHFELLEIFCIDAAVWLSLSPENVIVVHCKAGKGRTGFFIICFLMAYYGLSEAESISLFDFMRTINGKGLTIPSQKRYVHYFHRRLLGFGWLRENSKVCWVLEMSLGKRLTTALHLHNEKSFSGDGENSSIERVGQIKRELLPEADKQSFGSYSDSNTDLDEAVKGEDRKERPEKTQKDSLDSEASLDEPFHSTKKDFWKDNVILFLESVSLSEWKLEEGDEVSISVRHRPYETPAFYSSPDLNRILSSFNFVKKEDLSKENIVELMFDRLFIETKHKEKGRGLCDIERGQVIYRDYVEKNQGKKELAEMTTSEESIGGQRKKSEDAPRRGILLKEPDTEAEENPEEPRAEETKLLRSKKKRISKQDLNRYMARLSSHGSSFSVAGFDGIPEHTENSMRSKSFSVAEKNERKGLKSLSLEKKKSVLLGAKKETDKGASEEFSILKLQDLLRVRNSQLDLQHQLPRHSWEFTKKFPKISQPSVPKHSNKEKGASIKKSGHGETSSEGKENGSEVFFFLGTSVRVAPCYDVKIEISVNKASTASCWINTGFLIDLKRELVDQNSSTGIFEVILDKFQLDSKSKWYKDMKHQKASKDLNLKLVFRRYVNI